MLIAAAFVAWPGARRRTGGTLLAIGIVAILWTIERGGQRRGWTFVGPYPAIDAKRVLSRLGQPSYRPELVFSTLLVPLGAALIARRKAYSAALLSLAALTCLIRPSHVLLGPALGGNQGMPRRYHYDYFTPNSTAAGIDATIPAVLGAAGIVGWLWGGYGSHVSSRDGRGS